MDGNTDTILKATSLTYHRIYKKKKISFYLGNYVFLLNLPFFVLFFCPTILTTSFIWMYLSFSSVSRV